MVRSHSSSDLGAALKIPTDQWLEMGKLNQNRGISLDVLLYLSYRQKVTGSLGITHSN